MRKNYHLPFQNMTLESWINLAIAASLTFYIFQIGNAIVNGNICQHYAFDYCAYWSAGKIINKGDFSGIYNLDLLAPIQEEIYPKPIDPAMPFQPVEVPYLPIFLIPFALLSLTNLHMSYILWTAINLIGFLIYLKYFIKKIEGNSPPPKLLLMIFLSLPIFANLQEGQLNIWLGICTGEFILALLSNKPIKAGLWLGGWVIKPQILILIIPFLFIQRLYQILKGFIISSSTILLISFGLIKINGVLALINIFQELGGGGLTSNPPAMMNWRMLGWHIASFTSSSIGLGIIIIGALTTIVVTFHTFKGKITQQPTRFVIGMIGLLAATCAITWHSHLHMSIILIPPMIYLIMRDNFNKKLFLAWTFIPVFIELIGLIIAYFFQLLENQISSFQVLALSRGLPGFTFNLIFLSWAIDKYKKNINTHTQISKE